MWYYLLTLLVASLVSAQDDDTQVCYGDLGCFSTAAPWNRAIDRENNTWYTPAASAPPPRSPEELNNTIFLFTRRTSMNPELIYINRKFQNLKNLNCNRKMVIHIFGYGGYVDNDFLVDLRKATFKKENVNILALKWGTLFGQDNYAQSASDIRVVGAELARAIEDLRKHCKSRLNIEMISLSIGGPLMGYTGKSLKSMGAKPVQKIVACDSVGIGFDNGPPEIRLAKGDAEFVEAIHTDCNVFGTYVKQGDVDIFMNGCDEQPGCRTEGTPDISVHGCNHIKAIRFYTASLLANNCTYWGETRDKNNSPRHTPLLMACVMGACTSLDGAAQLPGRGSADVDTTKSCWFAEGLVLGGYKTVRSLWRSL